VNFDDAFNRVRIVLDKMACVFGERDPLLSSQGPITLYYWFFRNNPQTSDKREFLVKFENARKENGEVSTSDPEKGDQELLTFDLLNRSTNDQSSLFRRYQILEKRILRFRESEVV
jgi:hypothetical protein